MPGFLGHVVEATLPVLKICLLGAVGAGMAHAVSIVLSHAEHLCWFFLLPSVLIDHQATTVHTAHQSVRIQKHTSSFPSMTMLCKRDNCAMQGILDQAGRRTLSKLIYCLFTPALTFTKLAPVLSGQHLVLWMPLVINMFIRWARALAAVSSSVGMPTVV